MSGYRTPRYDIADLTEFHESPSGSLSVHPLSPHNSIALCPAQPPDYRASFIEDPERPGWCFGCGMANRAHMRVYG